MNYETTQIHDQITAGSGRRYTYRFLQYHGAWFTLLNLDGVEVGRRGRMRRDQMAALIAVFELGGTV